MPCDRMQLCFVLLEQRYCGLAKFIGTAWALWAQQCHKEKIKASRQVRVYLYRLFRDGGTCGWGVHTPICLLFGVIHWSRRPRGISAFNVALVRFYSWILSSRKYTINRRRVLYATCASAVISPLLKTVVVFVWKLAWKLCHTIEAFYSYTILLVAD